MPTDLIKRLPRLLPSLLLALLAFSMLHSARKLQRAADEQMLTAAERNAALFQQEISTKNKRVTECFSALTTAPTFIDAWDQQEAMDLLNEISNITRFLERIHSAEQIILRDRSHQSIVNLSAAQTRLPNELAENPGEGQSLRLSQAGDLFLLSSIAFKGTLEKGTLDVWQTVDPHTIPGSDADALWATIAPPKQKNATELQAVLLAQPENSTSTEWDAVVERR